ncbi:MAG: exodeoxyribonuclease V subunit gamma, partial [Succinivibrio sp.]|nr:exodeoxyribonuclease V subunit gamma [Succinivibrio sp.]
TEIEGFDSQVLGRFFKFIENIKHLRDEFILPEERDSSVKGNGEISRNLKEWSETLETEIFERFFYDGDDPLALESDTYRECSEIKRLCDDVSDVVERLRLDNQSDEHEAKDLKIALPVFRSMLKDKLSKSNEANTFKGSKVIFCSMIPMRAIPFKHIFILGMDDISFPRQDKIPAFNLVGVKGLFRRGDRSRSIDDRYCFMEAILSARESLYISYIGKSPIDNKERNRSTVLEDLFDYICDVFTVKGVGDSLDEDRSEEKVEKEITEALKSRLIRQETLTSFNPDNYTDELGSDLVIRHIPSFDSHSYVPEFYDSDLNAVKTREYLGNRGADYFGVSIEDKLTLDIRALKKWFVKPCESFLKSNLEVRLPATDSSDLSDDEDFSMGDFQRNNLLQELDGFSFDSAEKYLETQSEKGRLPYGVLSDGIKIGLMAQHKGLSAALDNSLGQRNISEHKYQRTFEVSLSEFSEVLNEPSFMNRKFTVEFSGTVSFPNILTDYYSKAESGANFIMDAVLNSFALHYASLPSLVSIISRDGKTVSYDVKLLGDNDFIDSVFKNLLSIVLIAMLRPLPVTKKMLTVVGDHKSQDKFFEHSAEAKYLFGDFDLLSDILKNFIYLGRSEDAIASVNGPIELYDILRSCSDREDKSSDKKTNKRDTAK